MRRTLNRAVVFLGLMACALIGFYPPWTANGPTWPNGWRAQVENDIASILKARRKAYEDAEAMTDAAIEAGLFPPKDDNGNELPALALMYDRVGNIVYHGQPMNVVETLRINVGRHFIFDRPDQISIRRLFHIPPKAEAFLSARYADGEGPSYGVNWRRLAVEWAIAVMAVVGLLWVINGLKRSVRPQTDLDELPSQGKPRSPSTSFRARSLRLRSLFSKWSPGGTRPLGVSDDVMQTAKEFFERGGCDYNTFQSYMKVNLAADQFTSAVEKNMLHIFQSLRGQAATSDRPLDFQLGVMDGNRHAKDKELPRERNRHGHSEY